MQQKFAYEIKKALANTGLTLEQVKSAIARHDEAVSSVFFRELSRHVHGEGMKEAMRLCQPGCTVKIASSDWVSQNCKFAGPRQDQMLRMKRDPQALELAADLLTQRGRMDLMPQVEEWVSRNGGKRGIWNAYMWESLKRQIERLIQGKGSEPAPEADLPPEAGGIPQIAANQAGAKQAMSLPRGAVDPALLNQYDATWGIDEPLRRRIMSAETSGAFDWKSFDQRYQRDPNYPRMRKDMEALMTSAKVPIMPPRGDAADRFGRPAPAGPKAPSREQLTDQLYDLSKTPMNPAYKQKVDEWKSLGYGKLPGFVGAAKKAELWVSKNCAFAKKKKKSKETPLDEVEHPFAVCKERNPGKSDAYCGYIKHQIEKGKGNE